ncbi:EamA family transporter RarD [Agarilytica rhodophyticola]|uniref:EamA family transporter RarD n=1 Tax=Agarilytica rhodophyticola TaxID=1737490 RepID=UPI002481B4F6|nr:EamA family transporter RarD [Agarilytica rhodophyticola]
MAISAYILWALSPVYFKALSFISATEILAHRVLGATLFLVAIVFLFKRYNRFKGIWGNSRILVGLALSTILIAINWGIFIWSVHNNLLLSASLGYFINPLFSILFGMLFLREKLDFLSKCAAGLCLFAVVLELFTFGSLPLVALILAFSFASYGLVRKKLGLDSLTGLTVETGLLFPFALAYLIFSDSPSLDFTSFSWQHSVLILMAGPVTAVPLIFFAAAANRISLTSMGFFQYIVPTSIFLLAVMVYDETLRIERLLTFIFIWLALLLLIFNSIRKTMKKRSLAYVSTS